MADAEFRCGFVAVVGRPNVGKSTLINRLLGSKVSIVTPKPQTTRHRILAVDTQDAFQAIYVDTPGLHRNAGKAMNRLMNRTAANALADADIVLFMVEANRWTPEDEDVLVRLEDVDAPVIAVLNKVDKVHPKSALLDALQKMAQRRDFAEVVPMSARRGEDVARIGALVPDYLPVSPPLFPADMLSDRSEEFLAAELIREKTDAGFASGGAVRAHRTDRETGTRREWCRDACCHLGRAGKPERHRRRQGRELAETDRPRGSSRSQRADGRAGTSRAVGQSKGQLGGQREGPPAAGLRIAVSGRQQVHNESAWLLHHRPFRDTSRILDVLSRDYGRLSLVARGSRGGRSRLKGILRPFMPLQLSWVIRGDMGTLTGAEVDGRPISLGGDALMSAYYINELVMHLVHRHDPQPDVYHCYCQALHDLQQGHGVAATLRRFEVALLELLGYALNLDHDTRTGELIDPEAVYEFRVEQGPVPVEGRSGPMVFSGRTLLGVAAQEFDDDESLLAAGRLLRHVIAWHLDGKELNSRKVLREMRQSAGSDRKRMSE